MTRIYYILLTLIVLRTCSLLTSPPSVKAITIDVNTNLGIMSPKGTGFHGGLADNVPDEFIDPIKPAFIRRPGGTKAWDRARRLNITLIELLSGYDYQGNWSAWESHVRSRVNEVKSQNISYHYDVWNEPDLSQFWSGSRAQFFEWWRDTYRLLKQIDPGCLVSGPSTATYNASWMNEFLTYAKNNQVVPDILSWHEMSAVTPTALENNVVSARTIITNLGINIPYFHNNEVLNFGPNIRPGTIIAHLGHTHRNNVLGAARAYWTNAESGARTQLNHLLTTSLQPRSAWWTHQRYASMTGSALLVTYDSLSDAVASKDLAQQKIFVLLGKYGSATGPTLTLTQISSVGFIGNRVRVTGQRIANSNTAALAEPAITYNQLINVVNNTVSVTIPDMNQYDAYFLVITPDSSTATPTPTSYSLDSDSDIDILDILTLISRFTQALVGDFNQNGRIDIFDFNTLLKNRL